MLTLVSSYNRVNGTYASETPLYKDVVRKEWGFQGSLMSDWYGTESTSAATEAGLDLEMPGPSKARGQKLLADIKSGRISTDVIDERVIGVLKVISRTKEVHSDADEEVGEDPATNALIRKIASNSIVLLKNSNDILPLKLEKDLKVAVIGGHATTYSCGGGSASGKPQYFKKPYDSIKAKHPQPDLVTLSSGVDLHRCIPMLPREKTTSKNGNPGVDVVYYNDASPELKQSECKPVGIIFMLGHLLPGLKETDGGFTCEMTTVVTPETTGTHTFAVLATGSFKLFVDDEEVRDLTPGWFSC